MSTRRILIAQEEILAKSVHHLLHPLQIISPKWNLVNLSTSGRSLMKMEINSVLKINPYRRRVGTIYLSKTIDLSGVE